MERCITVETYLKLASEAAVAGAEPSELKIPGLDWLKDLLTGTMSPAQITAAFGRGFAKFGAQLSFANFAGDMYAKLKAKDFAGAEDLLEAQGQLLTTCLTDELAVEAKTTLMPWDDAAVTAVANIINNFWKNLREHPTPTPAGPVFPLHLTPAQRAWNEKFDAMSEEEKKVELKRLVAKTKGVAAAEGILTSLLMTVLINFIARWGIAALQKWFPNLFPASLVLD